jgi:probable F420-dependent oxidoreductase
VTVAGPSASTLPVLRVDKVIPPGTTLSMTEITALAVHAERQGWDGLWTSEAKHDPFLPLLLAAEHSQRLTLGTSIAVAFARSPMTIAHSAHDLQRLSGGRFILGLGSQVQAHVVRRFSMTWDSPVARMKDFIRAVRAIWSAWQTGERLNYRGEFYSHTLMTPFFDPGPLDCAPPPIHLAVVGPAMTRAAGEVADGVILHGFTTPRYIREVTRPALREGVLAAGRLDTDVSASVMAFVCTGRDDAEIAAAVQAVKEQIGFYGSTPAYRGVMDLHGWGEAAEQLSAMARRGGDAWSRLGEVVTDDMVREFAVVADLDTVGTAIRERFTGLVDRVSFYTPYDLADDVADRVAADVRRTH